MGAARQDYGTEADSRASDEVHHIGDLLWVAERRLCRIAEALTAESSHAQAQRVEDALGLVRSVRLDRTGEHDDV